MGGGWVGTEVGTHAGTGVCHTFLNMPSFLLPKASQVQLIYTWTENRKNTPPRSDSNAPLSDRATFFSELQHINS